MIKLFGKKNSFEKINFEKVNELSQNDIFYKRKGNFWFFIYIYFRELNFIKHLKEISKSINLDKFFYKKIKFNKSKIEINIKPLTLIKIRKYYEKDNRILLKKHGIKYI